VLTKVLYLNLSYAETVCNTIFFGRVYLLLLI